MPPSSPPSLSVRYGFDLNILLVLISMLEEGCGQDLTEYTKRATTKQKAKEASAEAMACSGHCVSHLPSVCTMI